MSKIPNHWTFGKHIQIQIHGPLGSTSKIQSLDLWEARPRFQTIGPLGSMSKLQSIGPLGSMSKFNLRTSGKHIQDSNPSDLWEAHPNFNPSDLWEACPNFKSMDLWEARPKLQIHQTIGKHVLYSFKKKKRVACMNYV